MNTARERSPSGMSTSRDLKSASPSCYGRPGPPDPMLVHAGGQIQVHSFLQVPAHESRLIARIKPSVRQSDLCPAWRRIENVGAGFFFVCRRRRFDRYEGTFFGQDDQVAVGEDERAAAVA